MHIFTKCSNLAIKSTFSNCLAKSNYSNPTSASLKSLQEKSFFRFFLVLLASIILCNVSNAQTVVTFSTSGIWTCPAGVTSIQVESWGAGGAGGGAFAVSTRGGGGGGGAYTIATVSVIPTIGYSVTVGVGPAGTASAVGNPGGASSFNTVSAIANGGAGGGIGTTGAGGVGGIGTFNGGNGATGAAAGSGGGGGGAGSGGAGGNGTVTGGGTGGAIDGGAGANGITSSANGNAGSTYGGGGSGARRGSSTGAQSGGTGANGFVRLTFTPPCVAPTAQPTSLILTPSATNILGSFTASASANRYLVVRTASATAPTNPINGTTYIPGTLALGGYIEAAGTSTSFNSTGLSSGVQYWYWVFAYNSVTCGGGPLYRTITPLTGTATTLTCGGLTNTVILTNTSTTTLNWSGLSWSLGHVPTPCESALIILNRSTGTSTITVTINLDINFSVFNFTMVNASFAPGQTLFGTSGNVLANITGNMSISAPGANKFSRCVYGNANINNINGNLTLGTATPTATEGHASIGSAGGGTLYTYNLYGDMTYNPRGYTTDQEAIFNFNKAGTQYIYNYTRATDTLEAVLFETLNIGVTNPTTVIFAGTSFDAYIEAEKAAGVTIGVNSTLDLPGNYSLNKLTNYTNFAEPFNMLPGSKLRLGGDKSINVYGVIIGVAGSNFPANFNAYNFNGTSTVEYYGNNTITQTIYNVPTYANLLATNGTGIGRAQKITTAGITANTSFNINALTDVTLGTLGSSTLPVTSAGPVNVQSTGGLYCNDNEIKGAGTFTMSNGSYLGVGCPDGITVLGNPNGNVVMTGGRNYNTTGNYIYNGILPQVTGNGLPSVINELTTDNPTTVTIATNQLVNGAHLLKQGVFDIGATKITLNGVSTVSNITGKMKANQGIVEMKGTTGIAQNLSGNYFVNKTISTLINANTKGINVATVPADTLLISTAMNYGVGTTNSDIKTNDNLTLLSNATATANFGEIVTGSGNTITGKVNIERYLYARVAWRLLATPIVITGSPTVAQAWREGNSPLTSNGYGTMITGPTGPYNAAANVDEYTQRWSLKAYNSATNAWDVVTNTNTPLANTKGIAVFVIGDRGKAVSATAGATNLRIKGQIRTGDQVFPVPTGKFEMFGNPYPARIDFGTINKANIADAFTVWNPSIAGLFNVGGYETYVLNAGNYRLNGTGAIRNYIESGEAVFVQSNGAGAGSVTVKESDKGTGSALVNRVGVTIPTLEINMYAKDATGADYLADGVMLNFDAAHSAGVDNMDVRKIMNTYDNVAIKNGNFNLVVERRPNLTSTDTIKLNTTGLRVAPYRFEIDPSVLNNTGLEAFLKDKFLQTETAISFGAVTTVAFEATADAASRVADRFMIVFKQAPTTSFTTISATRNADKTVTVNWGTAAERNVTNYTIEQSNDGINFTSIATQAATANNGTNPTYSKQDAAASINNNWYRVKANNTNSTTKYTAIAMVGAINDATQIAASSMSIYPNPVEGGNVNLHLNNQVKGNYAVQITNAAGQVIKTENVQVENNNNLYTIQIANAAAGTYQATITDEAGNKTTIGFIVK
jgi:hypothetical protein